MEFLPKNLAQVCLKLDQKRLRNSLCNALRNKGNYFQSGNENFLSISETRSELKPV